MFTDIFALALNSKTLLSTIEKTVPWLQGRESGGLLKKYQSHGFTILQRKPSADAGISCNDDCLILLFKYNLPVG